MQRLFFFLYVFFSCFVFFSFLGYNLHDESGTFCNTVDGYKAKRINLICKKLNLFVFLLTYSMLKCRLLKVLLQCKNVETVRITSPWKIIDFITYANTLSKKLVRIQHGNHSISKQIDFISFMYVLSRSIMLIPKVRSAFIIRSVLWIFSIIILSGLNEELCIFSYWPRQ